MTYLPLILAVALSVVVPIRIFRNRPDGPVWANWLLSILGAPIFLSIVGIVFFVMARTNLFLMLELAVAILVSIVSATLCAIMSLRNRAAPPNRIMSL